MHERIVIRCTGRQRRHDPHVAPTARLPEQLVGMPLQQAGAAEEPPGRGKGLVACADGVREHRTRGVEALEHP